MNRPPSIRPVRAGFTLMEILLALALLAILGAVAWPYIGNAYSGVRLRSAAQQIQSEWGKARVKAISTGLPHVFRFNTQAGDYSVVPWQEENAAIEASMPIPVSNTTTAPSVPDTITTYSGAATTTGPKLPEGMLFVDIQRTSDTRSVTADSQLNAAGVSATAPPVVFYPDGTSTDAVLTITNGKGRNITINLRGLTGITRIGEITAGPEVTP
jgi:prepilin-type N-terminal cleavage/methylation domain-containing protein